MRTLRLVASELQRGFGKSGGCQTIRLCAFFRFLFSIPSFACSQIAILRLMSLGLGFSKDERRVFSRIKF